MYISQLSRQLLYSKQMWIYSLGITLLKMIPTSTIRTIDHSHSTTIPTRITSTTSPATSSGRLRLINGKMVDDNVPNNEAISEIIMASEINSLKVSSSSSCDESSMHRYSSNNNRQSAGRQTGASEFDVDADDGNVGNNVLTSLEYVISCMSTQNLHNRASLMYLLDVSITIFYNI